MARSLCSRGVAALAALAREGRLAALAGMDHSLRSTDVVSALWLTVAFARTCAVAFGERRERSFW
jgi:hypothetical protein